MYTYCVPKNGTQKNVVNDKPQIANTIGYFFLFSIFKENIVRYVR